MDIILTETLLVLLVVLKQDVLHVLLQILPVQDAEQVISFQADVVISVMLIVRHVLQRLHAPYVRVDIILKTENVTHVLLLLIVPQ